MSLFRVSSRPSLCQSDHRASSFHSPDTHSHRCVEQVYAARQSRPEGLDQAEASEQLARSGTNRLPPQKGRPLLLRFLDQVLHFVALLLWMGLSTLLVLAADTAHKSWLGSRPLGCAQ